MNRRQTRHGFVYDQLPAIVWALVIFGASSLPSDTLPKLEFIPSDKLVHLLVYLVLCALLHRALTYQEKYPVLSRQSLTWSMLLSIAYGASDELHQSFVTNRDASLYDLAADAAGAFLFGLIVFARQRLRTSK